MSLDDDVYTAFIACNCVDRRIQMIVDYCGLLMRVCSGPEKLTALYVPYCLILHSVIPTLCPLSGVS